MTDTLQYRRMYETKNVRPYYTVPHLGGFGLPLRELTGFSYEHSVYITSPEMNNEGYHEVGEMARATQHFRALWEDEARTAALLDDVKATFREATELEARGFQEDWTTKSDAELREEMDGYYSMLFRVFTRMLISQPQHVIGLDERISMLLSSREDRDALLTAATHYEGDLPWAEEERGLEQLHAAWGEMGQKGQDAALSDLVLRYGWFNEVEGDRPFDAEHYRKKVVEYAPAPTAAPPVSVPSDVAAVGRLIGELGFLRFWNRYHFMTVRYHLKKILEELVRRAENPDLEYATVEEMREFLNGRKPDLAEIAARKGGYASTLEDGRTKIVTGRAADELRERVQEETEEANEVRGVVANKGKAEGIVRVISFTASDYAEQVKAFQDGEILVTGMTRPQIVHLCKKAAAIVTDEGGITSHAAVVSREFGTPCIIATHNATRVLRTGDRVEVDAEQGIIRKL